MQRPEESATPSPGVRNLLLITIDCLRAGHVGTYGYDKPTTPNIDKLAAGGIRFANAFSNAPMTLPSIPQLFTSTVFPTKDVETLLEPVAKAGIPSAAIVNNAWIPLWLSQGKHAEPPGTLIDRELFRFAEIWAAAGHPHGVFKLTPDDLQKLTGAPVADVTQVAATA